MTGSNNRMTPYHDLIHRFQCFTNHALKHRPMLSKADLKRLLSITSSRGIMEAHYMSILLIM